MSHHLLSKAATVEGPDRRPAGIALALLATLLLSAVASQFYFISVVPELGMVHLRDDQMISMRVARMLWLHGVPYYNPDEAVAANTSLFWMYPLSLVFRVEPDPERAVIVVYLVSTFAWVSLAIWVAARQSGLAAQAATVLLIAFSTPALFYGGSGWEHVPQTALVTAGFLRLLKGLSLRAWLWCFYLVAVSFLVRPDSAPTIAAVFLAAVVLLPRAERGRFVLLCLPALAFPAAYLGAMLFWYGDVVPNTYYLKDAAQGARLRDGLAYLLDPRQAGIAPALWVFAMLFWRRLEAPVRVVLVAFALHAAYVAWVGGDVLLHGRFLLPYLPVLSLIAIGICAERGRAGLALAVSAAVAALSVTALWSEKVTISRASHVSQMRLAHLIEQAIPPSAGPVALHFLGIGYHLQDFRIVDFLGKADPVIARSRPKAGAIGHDKWDYDHSFAQNPVAVPIPHAYVVQVQANPDADYTSDEANFWHAAVAKAIATGRYSYLGPDDLCMAGNFGLFVRSAEAGAVRQTACGDASPGAATDQDRR